MRYYQPLWEKLKKEKVVSLTANRLHHPRIIKAVSKEKWMDFAHKALHDKIATLSHTRNGAVLTFRLHEKDFPLRPDDLGFSVIEESICPDQVMKPRSRFLASFAERLRKLSRY